MEVPRFTARYGASLVSALQALGIRQAFSERADFSGIAAGPQLTISSVNHAAYVRVDEHGTTAAAATSVGIAITAMREPQKTFVVNRPFIFALRDERVGSLLFLGMVRSLPKP